MNTTYVARPLNHEGQISTRAMLSSSNLNLLRRSVAPHLDSGEWPAAAITRLDHPGSGIPVEILILDHSQPDGFDHLDPPASWTWECDLPYLPGESGPPEA